MYKDDGVYIDNGILISYKKEWILPFATKYMDLEGIMLSEINQEEKDKYCMISLMCRIKKKITQTSEYSKKETHSQVQRTN